MRKILKFVLFLLIFINFIYLFSGAIHYPLVSVDVYSIWLLKAKEFYVNGVFPLRQLNQFPYSHPQYPILLPLVFSFIYKIAGGVNETIVLLFYPFVYLAILYMAYKFFRKLKISGTKALIITYIYSMLSPLLAVGGRMHAGEADIFLVLIYWGILHLAFSYFKKRDKSIGYFIAILAAIASQIKQEGVLVTAAILFFPAKIKDKVLWFLIAIAPTVLWIWIRSKAGLTADFGYTIPGFAELNVRIVTILYLIVSEMLNFRNWYIFWPLFWLVVLINRKKDLFIDRFVKPTTIVITILFLGNYLFSSLPPSFYIPSSIDRVMLQISPFAFLFMTSKIRQSIRMFMQIK